MKFFKNSGFFPVSERHLAAYLGISPSLFNMAKSGKHGNRQLSHVASSKMTELMTAHVQSKKSGTAGISLKKKKSDVGKIHKEIGKTMLIDAKISNGRAGILTNKLEEMIAKEKEDMDWLNTLDQLLETLPKTASSKNDRVWLEYQKVIVLKRLAKNDLLAQIKLETTIEMEKAKAKIYKKMKNKMMKNSRY